MREIFNLEKIQVEVNLLDVPLHVEDTLYVACGELHACQSAV